MARVPAYHTTTNEDFPPSHHDVYHDRDDCPAGKRIRREHGREGTASRVRCEDCVKLG